MSIVTLVSGGLDSTLMALLTKEAGIPQFTVFVNYGQRSADREFEACTQSMLAHGLPSPEVVQISDYGRFIRSGLTDSNLDIVEDAFTPGRNLLFLLLGAAHAYKVGADAVSIGLLNEETVLFPDQTSTFLDLASLLLTECMGKPVKVLTPLRSFFKKDVVALAREKGISTTYSCHAGSVAPCGVCISCREFQF
jgi:7-cyano-7-deazaguanine synthase